MKRRRRGNVTYGDGVYKSVDGGKNWKNVGLKDSRNIGAVIVDPKNADIVFVAALGHVFGPNQERGIFRTTDGGKTWTKVLSKDQNTGGIDVVFDPNNPNTLFAALWQMRRQPWFFSSGGPGSGLYRSIDGGTTWQQLQGNGLPDGILGRIGVSVSGADSNRIYAIIEAKEGGFSGRRMAERIGRTLMTTAASGSARGISARSTRTRNHLIPFTFSTPARSNRLMAANHSRCCRRVMAIITDSGSIRRTPIDSRMQMTAAPALQTTAARHGRRSRINRPRSFITSQWITRFRITSTVRNRIIRMSASRVEQMQGSSAGKTGMPPAAASAVLFLPIRATGTSFIPITKDS